MTTSPFVPKGETRFDSNQTCGYHPRTAATDCGKPGTWHVMWDRAPHDNSITCDEHMDLIRARWVYDDRHPIVPDCTMPGALWDYREKRCVFPSDEPALAVARQINGTP